jgi:hypothetical protein
MALHDRETGASVQVFLLAALAALAVGCGVAGAARQAAEIGLEVGDIVRFDPSDPSAFNSDARLTVVRQGGALCVLDTDVIRRSGGSLVLEQRSATPDLTYLVHWAGLRTSGQQAEDCGRDADLALSTTDMRALAAAAGGFGADQTPLLRLR